MPASGLDAQLARWVDAHIIDARTAEAIRVHESTGPADVPRLRWPVALVIALGGILLAAGVLLFIAAHWATLSPPERFAVVLGTLAVLHLLAEATSVPAMRTTLHAVGTVAFGAGIYLVGQIFNLQTHWPSGVLVWALGALAGALLLRDWPQVLLLAVLAPAWLTAEDVVARNDPFDRPIVATGLFLLALAYVGADAARRTSPRRAVGIAGAIALLPLGFALPAFVRSSWSYATPIEWAVALGVPIAVALALGGRAVVAVGAMIGWILVGPRGPIAGDAWPQASVYLWYALAALGIVLWGFGQRVARAINVGIASFAVVVGVFYFSNVMDKLGRSASLVGLGLLFLGGGYVLERVRRRLVAGATVPS